MSPEEFYLELSKHKNKIVNDKSILTLIDQYCCGQSFKLNGIFYVNRIENSVEISVSDDYETHINLYYIISDYKIIIIVPESFIAYKPVVYTYKKGSLKETIDSFSNDRLPNLELYDTSVDDITLGMLMRNSKSANKYI